MIQEISNENAAKLFNQLKAIPVTTWNNASSQDIRQLLEQSGQDMPEGLTAEDIGTGFRVLGKVAHEYGEETFLETVKTGEMPPLKLTAKEMEVVRGGLAIVTCILIGCLLGAAGGGAWGFFA